MGTTQNPAIGTEQSYVAQLAAAILSPGPEWIGQERTTARLNGQPAPVHQTHRRRIIPGTRDYEPVALTVLAPVALSLDDATAVLFGWETSYEELAEDNSVRALVADAVINEGGQRIEELRSQLSTQALDAEQRAYLAYCRNRAAEVFTARPVEQSSRRDRLVAGGCAAVSTALKAARQAVGWTKPVLIARLRRAGGLAGARVAQPQGLRVMLAGWENGYRQPSELYQRLLCQVYGRSGTELGFPTAAQPHQVDAGTGGGLVGDPDTVAALLYVAPLDTAALAAVCPAQARFYAGCVLDDPRCPPAAELAAGLARVRDTAPAWLDRARLEVSTALAREARTAGGLDPGRVPGWLRATRLHGCGITAQLFTHHDGTNRPDLAGWLVQVRPERPAALFSAPPETAPTRLGGDVGAVLAGECGQGRPARPGQHPPPVPAARDDAR